MEPNFEGVVGYSLVVAIVVCLALYYQMPVCSQFEGGSSFQLMEDELDNGAM